MTDTVFNCYVIRVAYYPQYFPPQYQIQAYLGDPDNGGTVVGLPVVIEQGEGLAGLAAGLISYLAALPPCL